MSEEHIEKLVDAKFLILMLTFLFYLDIWLLQAGVDPTKIPLQASYEALKNVSVFSAVLFVLSYSLLMAGFFPVLRRVIGLAQLGLRSNIHFSKGSPDEKRLSDWSLAFIGLSTYNAVIGFFKVASTYKGLSMFVVHFLQSDGLVAVVFRLSVVFLWLVCLSLSLKVDNPSPSNGSQTPDISPTVG